MRTTQIGYIIIILIICHSPLFSQQNVSIHAEKQPAAEVFRQIATQSGLIIYYNPANVDSLIVTLSCTDTQPIEAMQQILEGSHLQVFPFDNKYLFVLKDQKLITSLPDNFFKSSRIGEEKSNFATVLNKQKEQKATSENKVYTIMETLQLPVPVQSN